MPLYDFKCPKCNRIDREVHSQGGWPKSHKCADCRTEMDRAYDQFFRAQIHSQLSTMGYGMWHPQAGEVIRDYAHKKELMKRYGWEEGSDPVKGNRKMSEEAFNDDGQPDPHGAEIEWGDREMAEAAMRNKHASGPITIG